MEKKFLSYMLVGVLFIFTISGCVVRTYKVVKDRVDQDLTEGNRGYIFGEIPEEEKEIAPSTRTVRMVEIELFPPIKFERMKEKEPKQIIPKKMIEEAMPEESPQIVSTPVEIPKIKESEVFQKYTVQKNDSLQKISLKFYGTTKKWTKIYEANKDILKSPDKIYPGQVINIPLEDIIETPKKTDIEKIK